MAWSIYPINKNHDQLITNFKSGKMKIAILLALLVTLTSGKPSKEEAKTIKKREHPGCFIWWFLPGCYLGERVGVDPFNIYPWEKFCAKYTKLADHKKCEMYREVEEVQEEFAPTEIIIDRPKRSAEKKESAIKVVKKIPEALQKNVKYVNTIKKLWGKKDKLKTLLNKITRSAKK